MKNLKLLLVLLAAFVSSFALQQAHAGTVFFVNAENWPQPHVHYYGNNVNSEWTGPAMNKTSIQIDGKDLYSYTIPGSPSSVIFNQNSNTNQREASYSEGAVYYYFDNSLHTISELYVRGDFTGNDWAVNSDYKLTANGDGSFSGIIKKNSSIGTGFKIADANWKLNFGNGATINVGTEATVGYNGNGDMTWGGPATGRFKVTYNILTQKLLIENVEPNSYTFYIVNNTSENSIKAHFWEENKDDYMTTWPGELLTLSDSGKKFGGKTVYTSTISSYYDTKFILFNVNGDKKFGENDVEFGDGYLFELNNGSTTHHAAGTYNFDSAEQPDPVEPDDPSDQYTRTFYIVNKTSWSSIYGHYWEAANEKTNTTAWPGVELTLTATNDTYDKQPVYQVTINANYPADKIIFSDNGNSQTYDLALANGKLYVLSGSSCEVVSNPTFDRKPEPVAGRTLYFDFGQDRSNKGNKGEVPRIYLWTSQKGVNDKPVVSGMKEMYHSDVVDSYHDLWYYVIDEADVSKYKDFSFIYYYNDDNKTANDSFEYYTVGVGSSYNDMNNLYDYIYTTHDGHIAVQSYISPEQYIPLRQKEKTEIYLLGKGLKYGDRSLSWGIADDDVVTIPTDDRGAVFYLPVVFDGNWVYSGTNSNDNVNTSVQGAAFKMSWIKPSDYSKGNKNSDRLWATFNIGIIGYANSRNVNTPATMTDAGDNWNVWTKTSYTYRFNNHDQYNWFIPKNEATGNDYLLIVDLDDDCQSVTLLSFTPDPEVTTQEGSVKPESVNLIGPMEATTKLKGQDANGAIKFLRANMVSATIDINIPNENVLSTNSYTAQYQVYSNGERLGQPVERPTGIRVRGLAVGEDATIGCRAKYTDGKTGFTFHTRYDSTAVEVVPFNLKKPTLKVDGKATYVGGEGKLDINTPAQERWYSLGAYANILADHDTNDEKRVYYVDFEMEHQGGTAKGGELMHSNHAVWTADNTPTFVKLLEGWQHQGDSDYDDDLHNWSWAMTQAYSWPLHLPNVVTIHRDADDKDIIESNTFNNTVTVKARYVYPVVINTTATPELITEGKSASGAPARVNEADDDNETVDNQGWRLVLVQGEEATTNFDLTSGELTGVVDLTPAADDDAPVEYFNLQGMRLSEAPAAGCYIRRQGTKVEKIIIR